MTLTSVTLGVMPLTGAMIYAGIAFYVLTYRDTLGLAVGGARPC